MEQIHLAIIVASAFVGWTVTVIGATMWLASKFRALEIMFHKALNTHKEEDAHTFADHKARIQYIERELFGYTKAP